MLIAHDHVPQALTIFHTQNGPGQPEIAWGNKLLEEGNLKSDKFQNDLTYFIYHKSTGDKC